MCVMSASACAFMVHLRAGFGVSGVRVSGLYTVYAYRHSREKMSGYTARLLMQLSLFATAVLLGRSRLRSSVK